MLYKGLGDVALSVAPNVDKIADVQHSIARQTTMRDYILCSVANNDQDWY